MSESGIFYPTSISGVELDAFLAMGWFRMGQGVFTTNAIEQEEKIFRVFWLRYNLKQLAPDKKSTKKIIDCNARFEATIQPLNITQEMEELYELYKSAINFEPTSDIRQWLLEHNPSSVFDSCAIELRDQGKLIAVGIFDKGKKSIAGIMNFYNPLYKKYSPGKYLMMLKVKYALEKSMKWYYPGYIVAGYPKFDYKLFIDKLSAEIFLPELNSWIDYDEAVIHKWSGHHNIS